MPILKKIYNIANKLDQRGLYEEANMIDTLCKRAIEYPKDYDPGTEPAPEQWEMEMMEMDISPEEVEKELEYKEHEVPTEAKDIEELVFRTKMLLGKEGEGDDAPKWDILQPGFGYPESDEDEAGFDYPEFD